ncbi:hypothetical protein ACIBG4_22480 [Nonomuraea sp. NPDC050383]|uniref:hypothetical protein n=1 Tax=Nonomuraea sp. NPDC050383 TaxID=3364362 RepID=UPI0037899CB1
MGALEPRLRRAWEPDTFPPAECLVAIMTLAAVPHRLGLELAEHLMGGITVGPGSVPDLPGFEKLRAEPLPLQNGLWDRSAGIYDPELRRIGVGSVPSPSVSVCGHELGHAVDDLDGRPSHGQWWLVLHALHGVHAGPPYQESASELFAECFACVLTRRATRLIRLLGDERPAQRVYQWMVSRYGLG